MVFPFRRLLPGWMVVSDSGGVGNVGVSPPPPFLPEYKETGWEGGVAAGTKLSWSITGRSGGVKTGKSDDKVKPFGCKF